MAQPRGCCWAWHSMHSAAQGAPSAMQYIDDMQVKELQVQLATLQGQLSAKQGLETLVDECKELQAKLREKDGIIDKCKEELQEEIYHASHHPHHLPCPLPLSASYMNVGGTE